MLRWEWDSDSCEEDGPESLAEVTFEPRLEGVGGEIVRVFRVVRKCVWLVRGTEEVMYYLQYDSFLRDV